MRGGLNTEGSQENALREESREDLPQFVLHRLQVYEKVKARLASENSCVGNATISISLPDGKVVSGQEMETTPWDIAASISKGLADSAIAAQVNGEVWDLHRPLESDCELRMLKFDDPQGQDVFWHSSAHVLGQALELELHAMLVHGPALEQGGFFYDASTEGRTVSERDSAGLQDRMHRITKMKQPFERLLLTKAEAQEMFRYNPFKLDIIARKVPDGGVCTAYRCGPLIDLCRGPHVPHTGVVKALEVTKNSAAYWKGNASNPVLQRVYGISFPDKKRFKEHKAWEAEAKKRDHREIAKQQQLVMFHPLSPGCAFFLPHGTVIVNRLTEMIRKEYRARGYKEVVTPNLFNMKLWERSGHAQHYRENMFTLRAGGGGAEVEGERGCETQGEGGSADLQEVGAAGGEGGEEFGLKPMNCPGHCLIFGARHKSYRELPLRLADFGVLHRNEAAGALNGLTRLIRFQQDDAHIFCTEDQIADEIANTLDFIRVVYERLGLEYELCLSTRPEHKFVGNISQWEHAEEHLQQALNASGKQWKLKAGDGAFYGPKIDVTLVDALRRRHQCATIQLDFQLPVRFDLHYSGPDAVAGDLRRPVMIHRAVLGSVERMFAVLTESCAGKWPLWLSPRQVAVVPVSADQKEYASRVACDLEQAGFETQADLSNSTLPKKIRANQLAQFNYILVVGREEQAEGAVNVRTRDNIVHGKQALASFIARLHDEVAAFK